MREREREIKESGKESRSDFNKNNQKKSIEFNELIKKNQKRKLIISVSIKLKPAAEDMIF